MPFAVTVTFTVKPGDMQAFMPLMLDNARVSLETEAACHQFDVATDPSIPDTVFLYEIYEDRAAFDHHLATPHFKVFDAAVAEMIAAKTVRTFAQVTQ